MSAVAANVLEAVPVPDTLQGQEMQTFKVEEGRNYSYMFNFEQEFEPSVVRMWMEHNWRPVCAWASAIYLLLIFGGQSLMTNRQPFQLRGALTAWNILLSVFSIMGAARTLPEFIFTFSTQGFHHSLCVPSFIERDRVSGFWTWMFVLSKVPELGDTIFIVLRKQRLIFLHWYHHVTVLIYCWYSFSEYTAPARWFVVMNFLVHSLMYTYYAFRALRFRIPRCVAMVITSLQLVQMVVGCVVNYTAYTLKRRGVQCGVSNTNLQMSLLMYTSYFVLFARFFYNTYFKKSEKEKEAGRKSYFIGDSVMHSENKECNTGCKSQLALEEGKTQCTSVVNKGIKDRKEKCQDFPMNHHTIELPVDDSFITSEENKTPEEMDIPVDKRESNHLQTEESIIPSEENYIPVKSREDNKVRSDESIKTSEETEIFVENTENNEVLLEEAVETSEKKDILPENEPSKFVPKTKPTEDSLAH